MIPALRRFRPSKGNRWSQCAGSVAAEAALPDEPSSHYAAEGSAAHALGAECLREDRDALNFLGEVFDAEGIVHPGDCCGAPDQFQVTQEMADAVQVYLDDVRQFLATVRGQDYDLRIEETILSPIHPEASGTSDAAALQKWGFGVIWDYKHGVGQVVEIIANIQQVCYAIAWAEEYELTKVSMRIVQPRARHRDGKIREWTLTAKQLRTWKAKLEKKIEAALSPNAPLKGGSWCKWCKAIDTCPAFRKWTAERAQIDFSSEIIEDILPPVPMDVMDLYRILIVAPALEDFIARARGRALGAMMKGQRIPEWKLVRGTTKRKWILGEVRNEDELAEMLGRFPGIVTPWNSKVISPKQIEDGIKSVLPVGEARDTALSALAALWQKPEGAIVLARNTDPRAALEVTSAEDDFLDETLEDLL